MIRLSILSCLLLAVAAGCHWHDRDHRRHHDRGHEYRRYERDRGHYNDRDYCYEDGYRYGSRPRRR